MAAPPRTCSTENWTPVIEHGEDNESGIRTCLRQRWSHAAFPTTPGKPLRQTVPSGVVPAIPVYETTKRRGATPWGIREWDGRLSSLHQTLTHFYVMSAADSAHHGSACIATTEHMPTQTLTEVEIRRTDGSLHTYIHTKVIVCDECNGNIEFCFILLWAQIGPPNVWQNSKCLDT